MFPPRFRLRTLMIAVAAVALACGGSISLYRLRDLPIVWIAGAVRYVGGSVIHHTKTVQATIDADRPPGP